MNVVGGVVGLVVGLLFIGIVVVPFAAPLAPAILVIAQPAMIFAYAVALLTVYAIVSSLITTAIGNILTALLPGVFVAYCVLSLVYVIVTFLWLFFVFVPSIAAGAAASFVSSLAQTQALMSSSMLSTVIPLPQAPLLLFILLAPLHIIVTVVLYIVAGSLGVPSDVELFVRGLMVGFNAAVNGILTALFLASMSPGIVGGIPFVFALIGGIAALITFLAATTQRGWNTWNPIVKAIIGWSTPFLPTAWPTVMLGWFLYFCNHLVNGTAGFFGPGGFYSIRRISFWFGTHLTEGGVIANSSLSRPPNAVGTGWDLGSFAFIVSMRAATLPVPATTAIFSGRPTIEHESGHNLSLGAFGTWFHFIGAVDENVPPFARGRAAYAEQLAESNVVGTNLTSTFMWT